MNAPLQRSAEDLGSPGFGLLVPGLLSAFLVLLSVSGFVSNARAQANEPMIYTVGLTTKTNGQSWVYLYWRTTAFDLFAPRVWSVWRKDGLPSSSNTYTQLAVVKIQTQTEVLGGLMDRARLVLGEDTTALREALSQLFEDLIPENAVTTPELGSAVLQGVAKHPEHLGSLQLAMRTFPSMAMALGTAHALPIPASGPVTFEVRYRNSLDATDQGVVGRVTVDASSPLQLPPPDVVTVAPPDPAKPAKSDLAVPLRWSSPDALRRLALAQHGFNVYRVRRAFAESNNWHVVPPSPATLRGWLGNPAVGQVNRVPVYGTPALTAVEATTADHTVVHVTDHQSRFPGWPNNTPPANGDQYYYFVTARDLLGHEGPLSMPVLGTFCSRLPPKVPVITTVNNFYDYNGGSPKHHLLVIWKANPPEADKKTTAYALYRWRQTADLYKYGGHPASNLVAVIAHTNGVPTISYLDDGPGSPAAPGDYTKTFWYTVRAIDDSSVDEDGNPSPACAVPPFNGNLSGHSPPRWGVLRKHQGPGAPTGIVRIRCAQPACTIERENRLITPREELSPTQVYLEYYVTRTNADPNLEWVELDWGVSGQPPTFALIDRFEWEPGQTELRHRMAFPAALAGFSVLVRARAGTQNAVAQSETWPVTLPPANSNLVREVTVHTGVIYQPSVVDRDGVREDCFGHTPLPPDAPGGTNDGVEIVISLPPGSAQYKLYFRIDDGPLTLLKEDSGTFPATPITNLWKSLPVHAARACFFLQAFDIHGNPSPLTPLGCTGFNFKFGIPKPILSPILPGGDSNAPTAKIQWFCPKWGLERFELLLHSTPLPPDGLSLDLVANGVSTFGGVKFKKYLTDLIGPNFGEGSVFKLELPLDKEVEWTAAVRGVTPAGTKGKRSNEEEFQWSPPEIKTGPDVPWPARPLPGQTNATSFNIKILATMAPGGGGMVRIGEVIAGRVDREQQGGGGWWLILSDKNPLEFVYPGKIPKSPDERKVLPMALYRVQRPNATWPSVPGDVVQVSPLMETIAYTSSGSFIQVYDPFIYFESGSATPSAPLHMYLLDTQPAVRGALYRYLLVLFDPVTREIAEILVTNDVQL